MSSKLKQVKVNFRLETHAQIEFLATESNLTIAEWIRLQLDNKMSFGTEARERPTTKEHKRADPKLLYSLHKIGNNINQISHNCNINKSIDREVLASLIRIETELKTLL